MTTSIDFNTLPVSAPSMCIPRVFKNVTRERINAVFRDLDLGIIDRIDIISRENEKGDKFQRVFVHFKKWFRNENADRARELLIQGKEIKVIYDDPWFWKISANKSKVVDKDHKRKPQIHFESSPKKQPPHSPRSPSNSPPRSLESEAYNPLDYGNFATPKKRRVVQKPIEKKEVLHIEEN